MNKSVSYDGASTTLYAIWEQTAFGRAFDSIAAKLPSGSIVRSTGDLGLPTSGEGYTVSYKAATQTISPTPPAW